MYRKYYSYSDMPQLVRRPESAQARQEPEECGPPPSCEPPEEKCAADGTGKLFGRFDTDDIILAVIIFALLLDDGDDGLLLAALAFVFLTGRL